MKIKTSLKIIMFIILFYFARHSQIYLMILSFGVIHEIGHIFAYILLKKRIKNGQLKEIIVAMAGPITNALVILISQRLKLNIFTEIMVIISNLLIIAYNLIPIYPLDGGKVLKGVLHIFLGEEKANIYMDKISFIFIIIMTIIASIALLYIEEISIFLAIAYIWYGYLIENINKKNDKVDYKIIENY